MALLGVLGPAAQQQHTVRWKVTDCDKIVGHDVKPTDSAVNDVVSQSVHCFVVHSKLHGKPSVDLH